MLELSQLAVSELLSVAASASQARLPALAGLLVEKAR